MIEMLGAERLVYGRIGDTAVHRAPGLDAGAAEDRRHRRAACRGRAPALVRRGDTAASPVTMAPWPSLWPYPLWIAHRGAGKLAPENTLAAFRVGAAHGHRAFECDVKLRADGVPFLLHDATLERTTTARGVAGDRSWAELSRLDAGSWHSARLRRRADRQLRSDRRVLLPTRLRSTSRSSRARAPKHETGRDRRPSGAASSGAGAPVLLSSFKPQALTARARRRAGVAARAAARHACGRAGSRRRASLDCVAIVTDPQRDGRGAARAASTAPACARSSTPSTIRRGRAMVALGIDGIVTDAVDRFSPGAATCRPLSRARRAQRPNGSSAPRTRA